MKFNTILNILLVGLVAYYLYSNFYTGGYEKLDQASAYEQLQSDSSIQLVDVREPSEFSTGYIAGAQLIPLGTIEANFEAAIPDKDAKIFVYCRSGNRSGKATSILQNLGYKNVTNIGGIKTASKNLSIPIVTK